MMKVFRFLLFPFALLYRIVTDIRNRLYERGFKPVASFELPVISVGNLAAGGTGKTPMIEHLIRILKPRFKLATLSRGYGRKTKGIRLAGADDSALTVGDEPFQFYKKFREDVIVGVGEERALAIPYIIHEHPEVRVILLDDAFQHRRVKPALQILLTDYQFPFYNDFLLPAGRLRESRKGANRADVIVVTKCPVEIPEEELIAIEARIRSYSSCPVFFAAVRYGEIVPFSGSGGAAAENVVLVSGLANARPLEAFVSSEFKLMRHFEFADHYHYDENDIQKICEAAKSNNAIVLTTEKDATKLDDQRFRSFFSGISFFYLPIEVEFLKNGEDFDQMVLNAVKNA